MAMQPLPHAFDWPTWAANSPPPPPPPARTAPLAARVGWLLGESTGGGAVGGRRWWCAAILLNPSLLSPFVCNPEQTRRGCQQNDSTATEQVDGLVGGSAYCESGAVGSEWDYKAKLMMHDSARECRGAFTSESPMSYIFKI